MLRLVRFDAPGVLHHVMIPGIGRRKICRHNKEREDFVEHLSRLLPEADTADLYSNGRLPRQVEARSIYCYWAVCELGMSQSDMARRLRMTQPGVGYAVRRGERIAKQRNYQLIA